MNAAASRDRQRLLAGLPLTERRIRLAGSDTALLEGGNGPPLVLVHGGIECGGAYWAPVVPELAERHRLIVPDVPGLGESAPLSQIDAPGFGRWFEALLESTCEDRPAVVAHSLLGGLTADFAARHHGRLDRLCIYAAPGIGPYRMPLRLRAVAVRFALRTNRQNNERFERFALLDRDRTRLRDPAWFDSFSAYSLARARTPAVKRTMNRLVRAGTRRVSDATLRRIDVPVGLLWGSGDRMVPIGLAYGTRSRLGWPLSVVADAAHAPHIERPQTFVARLEQMLSPPFEPTLTAEAAR